MTMHAHVRRGDDHYNAKLTADDVRLIRDALVERAKLLKEARRLSNKQLGAKFGVGKRCIEQIAARESWGHV
jgi:hypothetical protein